MDAPGSIVAGRTADLELVGEDTAGVAVAVEPLATLVEKMNRSVRIDADRRLQPGSDRLDLLVL